MNIHHVRRRLSEIEDRTITARLAKLSESEQLRVFWRAVGATITLPDGDPFEMPVEQRRNYVAALRALRSSMRSTPALDAAFRKHLLENL